MREPKNQTNTTKPTSDPKISEKDLTLLENIIKSGIRITLINYLRAKILI